MNNAALKGIRTIAEQAYDAKDNWQLIDLKGRVVMFGLSCKEAAHYSNRYGYATRQANG